VGKSFVADLIASHPQEIADLRRQIRSAKPRAVTVNHTWAMDMTFFSDTQRINHAANVRFRTATFRGALARELRHCD
jgi:hypothetical protein